MTSTSGGSDVVPSVSRLPARTMMPSVQVRLTRTVSAGSTTPRIARQQRNSTTTMIASVPGHEPCEVSPEGVRRVHFNVREPRVVDLFGTACRFDDRFDLLVDAAAGGRALVPPPAGG